MFVSANFLSINYGIDDAISRFFVDRQPPANNLYWHEKLMYLRTDPGWLFIPLIADLLFKAGVDKQQVLSEEFVSLMEQIGHISAQEELKQISKEEATDKLIDLVKHNHKSESYYTNVVAFMKGEKGNPFFLLKTPYNALHRGDAFLFALCALQFDDELQEKLVKYWFALITTLLLLDDVEDMEVDNSTGDENAFLEAGVNKESIEKLVEMVKQNLQQIATINRAMAIQLDIKLVALKEKPQIKQVLN